MISGQHKATVRADVHAYFKRLLYACVAAAAVLCCAPGVHSDDSLASFFRFAGKTSKEDAPSSVVHRLANEGLVEADQIQLLVGDQVKTGTEVASQLVEEVAALIPGVIVGSRESAVCPEAAVAAFSLSGQYLLPPPNQSCSLLQVLWISDLLASREDCEVLHAEIYAYGIAHFDFFWCRTEIADETDLPAAHCLPHNDFEYGSAQLAVFVEPYCTYAWQMHEVAIDAKVAFAVRDAERPVLVECAKAWISRLVSSAATTEVRLESLIEAYESRSSHKRWHSFDLWIGVTQFGQLDLLLVQVDGGTATFPGTPALLQPGVVQLAANFDPLVKHSSLGFCGIQWVAVGAQHLDIGRSSEQDIQQEVA